MWKIPSQRSNQFIPNAGSFIVQSKDSTSYHLIIFHTLLSMAREPRACLSVHNWGGRLCDVMRQGHPLVKHAGVFRESVIASGEELARTMECSPSLVIDHLY